MKKVAKASNKQKKYTTSIETHDTDGKMEIASFVGSILMFYLILYYTDAYFKERHAPKYNQFLRRTNLHVSFLNIRWSTTTLNGFLTRLATNHPRYFDLWFNVGAIISVLLILPSIILLITTASSAISSLTGGKPVETALQPVLPGVNLPKSEWLYYAITLVVCTAFHEAGHALAAVREQVPLLGVGFLFFLIIPAAYVEIPTTSVTSLSSRKQLKIYCAGIWHNVALSVTAYVFLLILPLLSLPLYETGSGITVFGTSKDHGSHWFQHGDHISSVDDCEVFDSTSWKNCLTRALLESQQGFCVDKQHVPETKKRDLVCCGEEVKQSHLCFMANEAYYCIRARTVTESSLRRCNADNPCDSENHLCLIPNHETSNRTRLLRISRRNRDDVLFVGEPRELYSTVFVDDYVPRTFVFGSSFIRFIDHLLRYLISFSAGLAILNIVPCVAMDGQHITAALFELMLSSALSHSFIKCVIQWSIWLGTSLVTINVVIGVIALI